MAVGHDVYISGALTNTADLGAMRKFYELLADICRSDGLVPYLPHLQTDPELHADVSAERVYSHDVEQILAARVVVAYVGAASLGVGAELAIASAAKKPIIAVYRPDERVSRFALGMLRSASAVEVVAEDAELADKLLDGLRSVRVSGG